MINIPADHPVQPLGPNDNPKGRCTCGHCGLSWDDNKITSMTPAPSARCPFEYFHDLDSVDEDGLTSSERLEFEMDGDIPDRIKVQELLNVCKGVLNALQHEGRTNGTIVWMKPPQVPAGVHQSAFEYLDNAIEACEGGES